ncbi:MAG: hypothetical protein EOO41_03865, partial [Methanobacteriota archaeon]
MPRRTMGGTTSSPAAEAAHASEASLPPEQVVASAWARMIEVLPPPYVPPKPAAPTPLAPPGGLPPQHGGVRAFAPNARRASVGGTSTQAVVEHWRAWCEREEAKGNAQHVCSVVSASCDSMEDAFARELPTIATQHAGGNGATHAQSLLSLHDFPAYGSYASSKCLQFVLENGVCDMFTQLMLYCTIPGIKVRILRALDTWVRASPDVLLPNAAFHRMLVDITTACNRIRRERGRRASISGGAAAATTTAGVASAVAAATISGSTVDAFTVHMDGGSLSSARSCRSSRALSSST